MRTMTTSESTDAVAGSEAESPEPIDDVLIEDELIIEEISIDGMCGVY